MSKTNEQVELAQLTLSENEIQILYVSFQSASMRMLINSGFTQEAIRDLAEKLDLLLVTLTLREGV